MNNVQIIRKSGYEIIIERRSNLAEKFNGNILGNDNILIIRDMKTCIVFDADFDSYLIDHALPIKSIKSQNNFILKSSNTILEKTGYVDEDVKNLIKISIHLQLKNNNNYSNYRRFLNKRNNKRNDFGNYNEMFELTNEGLKVNLINKIINFYYKLILFFFI